MDIPLLNIIQYYLVIIPLFPLGPVLLNKLLPSDGLLIQEIQALLEISIAVVSRVLQEHHILSQFLCDRNREERLEDIGGDLVEGGGLSNDLAEFGDDSVGGVVVGGGENALVDGSREVLDGGLDKLA